MGVTSIGGGGKGGGGRYHVFNFGHVKFTMSVR